MKTSFSFLVLAGALFACNAQIAQVLESEDAGTIPGGPDAGPGGEQTSDGGPQADATVIVTKDGGVVDGGKRACNLDHECNEDLAMSSLAGACFEGVCICKVGFHVQPSGKCGETEPPLCAAQGGTCRTNPAECGGSELQADFGTTMKCGDIQPFQCCLPKSECYAPIDVVCCGAAAMYYEPNCVNGWRTCAAGAPTPRLRSQGCL
jgi:hypothetical protein